MQTRLPLLLLLLILLWAAVSGFYGLTTRDLQTWDEGNYYDEGRYVVQSARVAVGVLAGKIEASEARQAIHSLPPRMGRPLNCLLNAAAVAVVGERTWAPGLVAVLAGLICILITYIVLRRRAGEAGALCAALLVALSPYFLAYRRVGLPEASAAAMVLVTVWLLLRWREAGSVGRAALRQVVWLGVCCGLAFGLNTRTLAVLPVVMAWQAVWATGRRRLWQALLVLGGFAAMLVLYELPYLAANAALGRFGFELESYFGQLRRLMTVQQHLRPPGVLSAYHDTLWFAFHYEAPALLLVAVGLWAAWRKRDAVRLVPVSLLVLPALQAGLLIPYLRYNSWLLPLLAMIAGFGLSEILALRPQRLRWAPRLAAAVLLLVILLFDVDRGLPMLGAQARHQQALQWCRSQGAELVMTTNLSAAQAYAPTYRLEVMRQMEAAPATALENLQELLRRGRTLVIVDSHQYMNGPVMMSPEQYGRSAAAALRAQGRTLWRNPHQRGMTLWLFLEHNQRLDITLPMYQLAGQETQDIGVYDGREALPILERFEQQMLISANDNHPDDAMRSPAKRGLGMGRRGEPEALSGR